MTNEELCAYLEALLPNVVRKTEADAIKRALKDTRWNIVADRKEKKREARILARTDAVLASGTIEELDSLARLSRDQHVLRRIAQYNKHPQDQSVAVRKALWSSWQKDALRGAMVHAATRLENPREVFAIMQWWMSRREKYQRIRQKNLRSAYYIVEHSPCLSPDVLRTAIGDDQYDVEFRTFLLAGVSENTEVLKELIETSPDEEIRVRAIQHLVSSVPR